MLWETAGHQIAITGDGYYAPDSYGDVYAIRCIGCPGDPESDPSLHTLWQGEEGLSAEDLRIDTEAVLLAVVHHLRADDVDVSQEVTDAAVMLAGLTGIPDPGLDLLYGEMGGGERLHADDYLDDESPDED